MTETAVTQQGAMAAPAPAPTVAPSTIQVGGVQADVVPDAQSRGRRARLTVARIDPWSTLKVSFLLSVALGIAMVVAVMMLWLVLTGMGVFEAINDTLGQIFVDKGQPLINLMDYVGLGRVLSLAMVVAVIDVFLFTALATLSAFLYNLSATMVGGAQLTLTED